MRTATVRETRTVTSNGTVVVKRRIVPAPVLEWRLQAAAVRALRQMPEYGDAWEPDEDGIYPGFTLAGDFNAGRRSKHEATKAKATGLTPGEADVRIYIRGGQMRSIELKGELGRLSPDQKQRHALLRGLGFDVVVVKAASEDEAAKAAVNLVRAWLGQPANDNGTAR